MECLDSAVAGCSGIGSRTDEGACAAVRAGLCNEILRCHERCQASATLVALVEAKVASRLLQYSGGLVRSSFVAGSFSLEDWGWDALAGMQHDAWCMHVCMRVCRWQMADACPGSQEDVRRLREDAPQLLFATPWRLVRSSAMSASASQQRCFVGSAFARLQHLAFAAEKSKRGCEVRSCERGVLFVTEQTEHG